jgi:hypothetical protein
MILYEQTSENYVEQFWKQVSFNDSMSLDLKFKRLTVQDGLYRAPSIVFDIAQAVRDDLWKSYEA